jgi:Hemerythrin HHE cation binding domain
MTAAPGSGAGSGQSEALLAELQWVHGMIREDLSRVRRLAADAAAGQPAADVRAGLGALAVGSPIWSLRAHCLGHCSFVHAHHSLESRVLFPAVLRSDPALAAVVAKLEADHVAVAGLLEQVEAAVESLADADTPTGRQRLVDALQTLAADLLTHLDYEEEHLAPTLRSWPQWPVR